MVDIEKAYLYVASFLPVEKRERYIEMCKRRAMNNEEINLLQIRGEAFELPDKGFLVLTYPNYFNEEHDWPWEDYSDENGIERCRVVNQLRGKMTRQDLFNLIFNGFYFDQPVGFPVINMYFANQIIWDFVNKTPVDDDGYFDMSEYIEPFVEEKDNYDEKHTILKQKYTDMLTKKLERGHNLGKNVVSSISFCNIAMIEFNRVVIPDAEKLERCLIEKKYATLDDLPKISTNEDDWWDDMIIYGIVDNDYNLVDGYHRMACLMNNHSKEELSMMKIPMIIATKYSRSD